MNIFLDTDKRNIRIMCSVQYGDISVTVSEKHYDYDIFFDGVTCKRQTWNSLSSKEARDSMLFMKKIYDTTMECMKGIVVFYEMEGKDTYYINQLYRRMKVPYKEDELCNAIRNTFTTFMREA